MISEDFNNLPTEAKRIIMRDLRRIYEQGHRSRPRDSRTIYSIPGLKEI